MKKLLSVLILSLSVLFSTHPAFSQNTVSPCFKITGNPNASCNPVSTAWPLPVGLYTGSTPSGYCLVSNSPGTSASFQPCGSGGPPSGSAGGDLGGNYPNPTVLNVGHIASGLLLPANGGTGQSTYTDGQLLIGNTTGNTLSKSTLTAGSNISIANGHGTITISASGSPGGTSGQLQYNNNGVFGGVTTETLTAYKAHNTIMNGLAYDPRDAAYGAICGGYNTFVSDGSTKTFSYTIPFTGANSTDNTNFFVFYEGTSGFDPAVVLSGSDFSVTGVNSGSGTITLVSAVPVGKVLVVVHDDSAGLVAASTAAVASGGYVSVPDGCTIYGSQTNGTQLAEGAQLIGQGFTPNYTFQGTGILPIVRVIAPAGAPPAYGFNLSGKNQQFFEGFEITSNVPGFGNLGFLKVPVLIGANTGAGAGGGQSPGIVAQYVTFNEGGVGFGAPIGGSSGYIFAVLRFNNFTGNNVGIYGPLSDPVIIGNNFNSNGAFGSYGSAGGMVLGPQQGAAGSAGAGRVISNRFEFNLEGAVIQNATIVSFDDNQFDSNTFCGLDLNTFWANINLTGGWFRGNGTGTDTKGSTTAGRDAHVCFNGGSGSGGYHQSNVNFYTNYSRGSQAPIGTAGATTPTYAFDFGTAGTNNEDVEINNGDIKEEFGNNGAYVTGFVRLASTLPTKYKIDVVGQAVQGKNANGNNPALVRGIPPAQFGTLDAFGDHNTLAPNTPPPGSDYGTIVSGQMGASYNNYGIDGTLLCDSLDSGNVYAHQSGNTGSPLYLFLPSMGDTSYGSGSVPHEGDVNSCYRAASSWLATPNQYRVIGQNASCVQSGSWTNDTAFGGTVGVTTHTSGDTLTCTITSFGAPLYAWYRMHDSDGGTFTYAVDGGTPIAVTTAPNVSPMGQSTNHFGESLIRIPFMNAGSHSIVFTVTSSTNVLNNVYVLGVGTPPNVAYQGGGPTVFAAGQPYQLNDTFASFGNALNGLFQQSISQLQSDGLNVNFADIRKYMNFTTDTASQTTLSTAGEQKVADAFAGAIQYTTSASSGAGGYVDPRTFGAACNAKNFINTYGSTDNSVTTTAGSPVISINGYTFVDGTATATGGGDVGKSISVFSNSSSDVGPTTYIASVDTGTNTATLGENMLSNHTGAYAVMGGYPTNPADPSTAADDTLYIQNAANYAVANGGKVFLPNNCLVHDMALPTGTLLQGSMGGVDYEHAQPSLLPTTVLYIASNGHGNDPHTGINLAGGVSGADIRLQDFQIMCTNFPYTGFYGQTLAGVGTETNMTLHSEGVVLDHISHFLCPVQFGVPFGLNQPVGFTASISGTAMTVTSIDTTNFNTVYGAGSPDWLAMNRPVTGAGVTAGTKIIGMPPAQVFPGFTGVYTVNNSQTVSSESMTSPAATVFLTGQTRFNEFSSFGFGINGDFTDFSEVGSTFTGACLWLGPNTGGSTGNGANKFSLSRFEECANPAAVELDGTTIDQFNGVQWQFNQGYGIHTRNGVSDIQLTGGMLQGSATTATNHAQIDFSGTTTRFSVVGTQFDKNNFAFGGTSAYIFGSDAASTTDYISVEGGNVRNGFNTATTNWVGTAPTHYKQYSPGIAIIDSTQSTLSQNLSGAIGIGTTSATAGSVLDMSSANAATNSSILLAGGTLANRPSSPVAGMLRYNSTVPDLEAYYNSTWNALASTSSTPLSIGGLGLSNDNATPNTIFDIASGAATSDDNLTTLTLNSMITKTTASWTVGSGLGCLDTGSVANSTWYYVFLIERTDTNVVDTLCSASITAPVMPTNYTAKRLIGFLETDASAHLIPFTQHGGTYTWVTPTLDLNTSSLSTSGVLETLNVPLGVNVQPICRATMSKDGHSVLLTSPDETDAAPSNANPMTAAPGEDIADTTIAAGVVNTVCPKIITNIAGQIRARSSASGTTLSIVTRGYVADLTQPVPLSPSVSLDFTTGTLPSSVTFSRASTGWYFNSSGNLTSASTNVARFDYGTPGSVTLLGLLTEGSATNFLLWSRDLTQTGSWTATSATVALDQTGIDGASNTASSITATGSNGKVCQPITHASSGVVSSVYLKRVTGSGAITISQDNNSTTSATVLTGSWQRFFLGEQSLTNPTFCVNIATNTDEIAVDVAQTEIAPPHLASTSPIVTTSATVTRAADSVTLSPTPWYNKSAGAIRYQYRQPTSGQSVITLFAFNNSGYGLGVNNGTAGFCGATIGSSLYNATEDAACSYSAPAGVFSTTVNAVSKGAGAGLANIPTSVVFGGVASSWAQKFQYWPYALTTAQLQSVAP